MDMCKCVNVTSCVLDAAAGCLTVADLSSHHKSMRFQQNEKNNKKS